MPCLHVQIIACKFYLGPGAFELNVSMNVYRRSIAAEYSLRGCLDVW